MTCCLLRAKKLAIGPFYAHFEERLLLKFADHPLHQTLTHRRCGAPFVSVFCGEERDSATGAWLSTRWILIPLNNDELADMELTPTAILGERRQGLIPILRAEQWFWLTEGPDRGIGVWGARLPNLKAITGLPPGDWPHLVQDPTTERLSI